MKTIIIILAFAAFLAANAGETAMTAARTSERTQILDSL